MLVAKLALIVLWKKACIIWQQGTFNNDALVTIGEMGIMGTHGIFNGATINNNACALLRMFAPLNNENTLHQHGAFYCKYHRCSYQYCPDQQRHHRIPAGQSHPECHEQ